MIYRDAIGRPNAEANISMYGGLMSPAYYIAYPMSMIARIANGAVTQPPETIAAEMEADGWQCTIARIDMAGQRLIVSTWRRKPPLTRPRRR